MFLSTTRYVHLGLSSITFSLTSQWSYPATPASARRIIGEIQKLTTSLFPAELSGATPGMKSSKDETICYYTDVNLVTWLGWLSPATILLRHPPQAAVEGTCEWMFSNGSFRSWLVQETNSVLWISGKPGSGKTVLASFLVDSIREDTLELQSPAICSSLFFDFRYSIQRVRGSAKGTLLQTLLYQLLEQEPSIISRLPPACNSGSHILDRPETLDYQYYQKCLRSVLSVATSTNTVFVIIDALDECDQDTQDDILSCIQMIYSAPDSLKKIRIAITSRNLPKTKQSFRTDHICLEMENAPDISIFCETTLRSKVMGFKMVLNEPDLDIQEAEYRSLLRLITERAQGMFLWTYLSMELLDASALLRADHETKDLHNKIAELPTDLDCLYDVIMERSNRHHRSMTRLLLAWCYHSFSPLEETAIHTALRYTSEEPDELFSHIEALTVLKLCAGLIEVRRDPISHARTVQLVHFTAKEYFAGLGARHLPSQGEAHTLIAKACVSYLTRSAFVSKGTEDQFFHYCVFNWGFHAEAGDRHGLSQNYLIELFQWPSVDLVSLWLDAYHRLKPPQSRYSNKTSLLHVASHYGILSIASALLSHDSTKGAWHTKDGIGYTPLHHAVTSGHFEVAMLLLDHGAEVNCLNSDGHTPLLLAAQNYYSMDIVKLLLESGADINHADIHGKTALHYAAKIGSPELVQYLIHRGANQYALSHDGTSVLALAAASGREALAESLLVNRSLSESSGWPETALQLTLAFAAALGLKAFNSISPIIWSVPWPRRSMRGTGFYNCSCVV